MKIFLLVAMCMMGASAFSQMESDAEQMPAPVTDVNRGPAQDTSPGQPTNDNELRVQNQLPDAELKQDTRSIQNQVYKTLFKRDLKPDQREDVIDE